MHAWIQTKFMQIKYFEGREGGIYFPPRTMFLQLLHYFTYIEWFRLLFWCHLTKTLKLKAIMWKIDELYFFFRTRRSSDRADHRLNTSSKKPVKQHGQASELANLRPNRRPPRGTEDSKVPGVWSPYRPVQLVHARGSIRWPNYCPDPWRRDWAQATTKVSHSKSA